MRAENNSLGGKVEYSWGRKEKCIGQEVEEPVLESRGSVDAQKCMMLRTGMPGNIYKG